MISGLQKRLLVDSLKDEQWIDPSGYDAEPDDLALLDLVNKPPLKDPREWPTSSPAATQSAELAQDKTFGRIGVTWTSEVGQARELARFPVPHGFYGVVRNIDQYVMVRAVGVGSYLTDADNWGRPFRDIDVGLSLRWHLRMDHIPILGYPGTIGGWFPAVNLPGLPFKDLGVWQDLRHAWGLPERLHYMIEGGFVLRYFVEVVSAAPWLRIPGYVAGRLQGFTQEARSRAALWTSSRTW